MSIKIDTKFAQTFYNLGGYSKTVYGRNITVDGRDGPETKKVTRHYQSKHKLVVDGVIGPQTKGQITKEVQNTFNEKGISQVCLNGGVLAVDGDFKEVSINVTKCFQKMAKITVDGIFYLETLKALYAYSPITQKPSTKPAQKPGTEPEYRIGYYINDNATPLNKINWKELKEEGINSVAILVGNPRELTGVKEKLQEAGIEGWAWIMDGSPYARELAEMGWNILVDVETYKMESRLSYLKQMREDTKNAKFMICIKPPGWDGDQKVDELVKLCDYVTFMTYTGDYFKTNLELSKIYEQWNRKYPGKFIASLESYRSDRDVVPKENSVLRAEMESVKIYTKGIFIFRYGLSKLDLKHFPPISTVDSTMNYGTLTTDGWVRIQYTRDSQDTNYTCGPSSLKMALSVYGIYYDEQTLTTRLGCKARAGTKNKAIVNFVSSIGLKAWEETFKDWETLQGYLLKGWPVLLRIASYYTDGGEHYVLLAGLNIQEGRVELGDPSNKGFRTTSTSDLLNRIKKVSVSSVIVIAR